MLLANQLLERLRPIAPGDDDIVDLRRSVSQRVSQRVSQPRGVGWPNRVKPSRVKPSRVKPSRVKPSRVNWLRIGTGRGGFGHRTRNGYTKSLVTFEGLQNAIASLKSAPTCNLQTSIADERPPHKEAHAYGCGVSTLTRFARPPLQRPLVSGQYLSPLPYTPLYAYQGRSSKEGFDCGFRISDCGF